MNRDHATTLAIAERAAEWLIRLPTADAQERQEFMSWLRESPVHVCEFLLAVRCAERLRFLDRQHLMNVDFSEATHNVARLPPLTSPTDTVHVSGGTLSRRSLMLKVAAVLAVIALIPLVIVGVRAISGPGSISTSAGEWRTERLPDGSELRVGPRTEIVVDFTRDKRVVRLVQGELLIHVAKDPARPLFVESDQAVACAVGTAFAVRRDPEITSITVKEGVVAVSATRSRAAGEPITLRTGQQVQVSLLELPVRSVDLDKELAWANARLIFDTEQVSDAVREFNVRNEIQLKVLSPELARRPIRGAFAANDPLSFAKALEAQGTVSIAAASPRVLLLVSRQASTERVRTVR